MLYFLHSLSPQSGVKALNRARVRSGWRLPSSVQIGLFALAIILALVLPLTPQASAATTNVTIVNFAFQDSSINVQLGDTVIWTNSVTTQHTVTSDGGAGPLDSPTLNQGDTYSFTFIAEGTYNYHCALHSTMKGTVIVGTVIPEFSGAAFVAIGLMAVLLVLVAVGRKQ